MTNYTFTAPCLFGLEGIAADELKRLDFANVETSDGRIRFSGDFSAMAAANIRSRYCERVLWELGRFHATTFTELFDNVKAIRWEDYLPRDARFPVDGYSVKSGLASIPDCQKIVKKAIVEAMKRKYHVERFAETGTEYRIRFSILRDEVSIGLDASGEGLHKRGYRAVGNAAPLRETLAAAMLDLARVKPRDAFLDPFCGSGTIAIEAALRLTNRAPGLYRSFAAESWEFLDRDIFRAERERAKADERDLSGITLDIEARDIDPRCAALTRENAKKAGVADLIRVGVADAREPCGFDGVIVTNPPYGERLGDHEEAHALYADYAKALNPRARAYILSADEDFERHFHRRSTKKRKLYNGMIRCNLYMYF